MFDVKDTLLPPTATPLAKALDILEERLFSLPVQMISKDPVTVDVGLLDHLAWENSVDTWDSDWPEDVKRNAIAASLEVHRYKGTRFAISQALSPFGVKVEILEWFESEGVVLLMPPGSFRATAFAGRPLYGAGGAVFDSRMLKSMTAIVQRVAPVSRKLSFRLGYLQHQHLRVATHGQTAIAMRGFSDVKRPVTSVGQRARLSATARGAVRCTGRAKVQRRSIHNEGHYGFSQSAIAAARFAGHAIAKRPPNSVFAITTLMGGGTAAVRVSGSAVAERYNQ